MWIGADEGLFHVANRESEPQSRGGETGEVNALLSDGARGVWIGADEGLFHVANRESEPQPRGGETGEVRALLSDGAAGVWVGASRGLFHAASPTADIRPSERLGVMMHTFSALEDHIGVIYGDRWGVYEWRDPRAQNAP